MAQVEGQIELFLHNPGGRVNGARLLSSRPITACRLLIGKPVEEIPRIVSLLYSICGQAQTLAAVAACECAAGIQTPAAIRTSRECLALAETIREHAWRFLIDWPKLMGQRPTIGLFQPLQQTLGALSKDLCHEGVCWHLGAAEMVQQTELMLPVLDRIEQTLSQEMGIRASHLDPDLRTWQDQEGAVASLLQIIHEKHLQGLGASDVALLPKLPLRELNTRLDEDEDDQFVTRPCWHGSVYETGPVTRMADHPAVATLIQRYGCGLLARITARLAELLGLPMAIRGRLQGAAHPQRVVETISPTPGIGLAVVETARGRLVHRVELDGTRVRRYQVLAPTEWNFHPNGPLIRGLRGMAAESPQALTEQAAMAVMALDPCVGYTISIDPC